MLGIKGYSDDVGLPIPDDAAVKGVIDVALENYRDRFCHHLLSSPHIASSNTLQHADESTSAVLAIAR
jgi:hypothetical protein